MATENKNGKEISDSVKESDSDGVDKTEKKTITLTIKTQKNTQKLDVDKNSTIKDLKELASAKFDAEANRLQLIFAGKTLKDQETLQFYNIKEGSTVYLIIKSVVTQTPESQPSSNPYGLDNMGFLNSLQNLHIGSPSLTTLTENVPEANPDLIQQLLNNPVLTGIANDPETIRFLLTANPQIQEVMNRHPELNHLLNNRELLQETMNVARNPALYQELLRSNDRAMRQLENAPGGFNALQRIYQEVHEPLIDAFQRNPYSEPNRNSDSERESTNPQQGSENRNPLPNPWSGVQRNNSSNTNQGNENAPRNNSPLSNNSRLFEHFQTLFSPELLNTIMTSYQSSQGVSLSPSTISALNLPLLIPPTNTSDTPTANRQENVTGQDNNHPPPAERYRSQLEQLQTMGFENAEDNLQALIASGGDINLAIDRLIRNN